MGKLMRQLSYTLTQIIPKCLFLLLWAIANPIWVVWGFIIYRYTTHSQALESTSSTSPDKVLLRLDFIGSTIKRTLPVSLSPLHCCEVPRPWDLGTCITTARVPAPTKDSLDPSAPLVAPSIITLTAKQSKPSASVWHHHQLITHKKR